MARHIFCTHGNSSLVESSAAQVARSGGGTEIKMAANQSTWIQMPFNLPSLLNGWDINLVELAFRVTVPSGVTFRRVDLWRGGTLIKASAQYSQVTGEDLKAFEPLRSGETIWRVGVEPTRVTAGIVMSLWYEWKTANSLLIIHGASASLNDVEAGA